MEWQNLETYIHRIQPIIKRSQGVLVVVGLFFGFFISRCVVMEEGSPPDGYTAPAPRVKIPEEVLPG